jgi:S-adenosylmethionine decarboxylase
MRNLKLKQVLPVDTEIETLQEFKEAEGFRTASTTAGLDLTTNTTRLHSVKETPGLHVMGDLYDVQCDERFLIDIDLLTEHCIGLVQKAGLSTVGQYFHQFEGGGVTGMVVLAESHMSVHTWPEKKYVTVDVYVCSYSQDNRPRARQLYQSLLDTFQPEREISHSVERL